MLREKEAPGAEEVGAGCKNGSAAEACLCGKAGCCAVACIGKAPVHQSSGMVTLTTSYALWQCSELHAVLQDPQRGSDVQSMEA